MLTRLRVRGFKNLYDVEVHFGPFTCVAGKNAVGKSNLFDAIRFLHLLTKHPIMEAAQRLRETKGRSPDPRSLFTTFGLFRARELRFEADMILDREVQDDFGVGATAAISSVRYEVAFRLDDEERPERLELVHEKLDPIPQYEAGRNLGFPCTPEFRGSILQGRRAKTRPFISTSRDEAAGYQIKVHHEGHGGRKVPAPKSSRTVIGGMASSDFPTILATHREMESWETLMLEPSAMRAPSEYRDPAVLDGRGANLPAAIERLRRKESQAGEIHAELTNRLADLIDDVRGLRVRDDRATETLTLEARGRDGTYHPARSLSDGTLRFLVLAVLALDPEARGLISLEEPENGIHPERMPAMLDLLRDIAVDPALPVGDDNPLRQVIVNTHSPAVVRNVDKNELVYVKEKSAVLGDARARVAYVTAPKDTWRTRLPEGPPEVPRGDLEPYLGEVSGPQLELALTAS